MTIHICRPDIQDVRLVQAHCPTCNKMRYFCGWFQEWYGWHDTCLGCGDQWQDGDMLDRPFRPRWRKENIAAAKELYRRIHPATA